MRKSIYYFQLPIIFAWIVFFLFGMMLKANAQSNIPFEIKNNSPYSDNQLYVTIVGEDLTGPPGAHVWIDCANSTQKLMSANYNTLTGPVYGGNRGPGNNGMYANCFTKLSDIPNKTVSLPPIQGCRMFISVGQPLYLYFFGATGAPSGYASPNHTDPTDPSQGIIYEMIELTYNQYGFWGNTTRVDGYNYPMGLELLGAGSFYQKTGELKTHQQIGADFWASVPTEFQSCYNATTGSITFPTKTAAWADGSIGTMPNVGPYVNYMKNYIDAIWTKYKNEDLFFDAGDAGQWKGRVVAEQLIMTCVSGGFLGRKGIVDRRPTTQEAFEGKGVLDRVIQDATTDLVVEAQLCAALTRHVINTTTPNVGLQNWSNPTTFYQTSPCNYYAKFFHNSSISYNQLSYGFAYDDVFNQSSTLHTPSPTKAIVTFGGFANTSIPEGPYQGSAQNIPGKIIMTNYNVGVENTAYHDVSINNEGGQYRLTEGVDIEFSTKENTNTVGWITDGEWMRYTVNVVTTNNYEIQFRHTGFVGNISLLLDGNTILNNVSLPSTNAWDNWITTNLGRINLSSGQHILTFKVNAGNFNANFLTFKIVSTINLSNIIKTYGDVPFTMNASSNNTNSINYSLQTGNAITLSNNGNASIVSSGTTTVIASVVENATHTSASVTSTVTINKKVLTITADNKSKTANTPNPTLTITYSGFAYSDNLASLTSNAIASTTAQTNSAAGNYTISVAGASATNYNFNYVNGILRINPIVLTNPTIVFNPIIKTYGDASFNLMPSSSSNGAFTYTIINGNTFATINPNGVVTITGAGSVTIQANQSASGTFAAGSQLTTLTINKKILTITADHKSKTANTPNPLLTITYSGFAYSDNLSSLTSEAVASTTAQTNSTAGNYPITVTGASANNYNFNYVNGVLLINAIVLNNPSIVFNPIIKTYGDASFNLTPSSTSNGAFTYSIINGNAYANINPNGVVTIIGAGTVTIQANQSASGTFAAASKITTLSINKKLILVNVNSESKIEDTPNPLFKISYVGFVNNNTEQDLISKAIATTTATTNSSVGEYPIILSGALSNNYDFQYTTGILTIQAITETNEHFVEQHINLYPNPSSLNTTLQVTSIYIGQSIKIIDNQGQVVYEGIIHSTINPLNTLMLNAGLYTILFENGNSLKFIKQ